MSLLSRPSPLPRRDAPLAITVKPPSPAPRTGREPGRLPSLDGLRALSIGLVLLSHLWLSGTAPLLEPLWHFDVGKVGVRIFFVLSGFLITTLLLEEHATRGTISLRRFYFRRTLRLVPAYAVFLLAMALAAALGLVAAAGGDLLYAGAYLSNFPRMATALAHTWSVSVQEQFYLLWPGLLLLIGLRRAFLAAAALLVAFPVLRTLGVYGILGPTTPRYALEWVAEPLLVGCLLAQLRGRLWAWAPYRRFLGSPLPALLPPALVGLAWGNVHNRTFAAAAGVTLFNLGVAVGLDWCLRFPSGRVGRVLNCRPVVFVGAVSYSLYLWQQPFLLHANPLPCPLNLLALIAAALLSFYLVERPALGLRGRLERWLFPRRLPVRHAAEPMAGGAGEVPAPQPSQAKSAVRADAVPV